MNENVLPYSYDNFPLYVIDDNHKWCDEGRVGGREIDDVFVVQPPKGRPDGGQVKQATPVTLHKLLTTEKS